MRIVFMGTPAFAIPTLDVLINQGHTIVGVISATDKMGGRSNSVLIQSAVSKYAIQHNLKLLQPKNLKSPSFIEELKSLNAEVQVVVAFRMLPEVVWNMPEHGTINLHGSLLPKYRGAAPLNWAIINGETETGVTAFRLKHKIDTGDIILSKKMRIKAEDNIGSLHDRMMYLGASTIAAAIDKLISGNVDFLPQSDEKATPAPKLNRANCKLDFNDQVENLHNKVRGLSPYPSSWTTDTKGNEFKIYETSCEKTNHDDEVGTWKTDGKNFIKIACKDGYLYLKELQMSGKRKMKVKDFLNGYKM